jgi:hypothetical protein
MDSKKLEKMEEAGSPEFVDAKGARRVFGLSRAHLYELIKAGAVRSCCIRRPGAFRGRRLFCCRSLREFLAAHMEELS